MKPDRARKPAAAARAGGARALAQAPHKVRIIGGRYKRTPLPVADAPGLRPTPDRVRETLFNWIAHLKPDLAALRGLDLFAGTGALGFELASRGAVEVLLVERSAALAAQLRATQAKLQASAVEVRVGDALAVARALAQTAPARFDLVFLDPPFDAGLHASALEKVLPLLAPEGLVYVENRADSAPLAEALGLTLVRSLTAGQVWAQLFARTTAPTAAAGQLPLPADH